LVPSGYSEDLILVFKYPIRVVAQAERLPRLKHNVQCEWEGGIRIKARAEIVRRNKSYRSFGTAQLHGLR
jgi:hypothetical protein